MTYHIECKTYGKWRWYLTANNGKRIAESPEDFHSPEECFKAVNLVKATAREASVVLEGEK